MCACVCIIYRETARRKTILYVRNLYLYIILYIMCKEEETRTVGRAIGREKIREKERVRD